MDGQVGVVFGGAGGIGQAMVKMLLQHGCKVVFADISEEKGKELELELLKIFHQSVKFSMCDVMDHADIEGAFNLATQLFGVPTICINCAGICNEIQWRKVLRINLEGAFDITESGFAAMSKDKGAHGGVMIHLSSIVGLMPSNTCPGYCASKAGVVAMVRSFGTPEHYSVHGVRIHVLCPGHTDTEFLSTPYQNGRLMDKPVDLDGCEKLLSAKFIQQSPEAVAEAAKELIEDGEKNGQVVAVIGGQTYVEEETRAAFYQPLLFQGTTSTQHDLE